MESQEAYDCFVQYFNLHGLSFGQALREKMKTLCTLIAKGFPRNVLTSHILSQLGIKLNEPVSAVS
jgi:hypothetical protein